MTLERACELLGEAGDFVYVHEVADVATRDLALLLFDRAKSHRGRRRRILVDAANRLMAEAATEDPDSPSPVSVAQQVLDCLSGTELFDLTFINLADIDYPLRVAKALRRYVRFSRNRLCQAGRIAMLTAAVRLESLALEASR